MEYGWKKAYDYFEPNGKIKIKENHNYNDTHTWYFQKGLKEASVMYDENLIHLLWLVYGDFIFLRTCEESDGCIMDRRNKNKFFTNPLFIIISGVIQFQGRNLMLKFIIFLLGRK